MNTPEPKKERYITVRTVAERLSCTDNYVYALIKEGKLLAVKIGERALRVSEASLESFISGNIVNPADYFSSAPEPEPPPESRPGAVARSSWMRK